MARVTGGREVRRRMLRIRGAVPVGLVAAVARRWQRSVVVVCMARYASDRGMHSG